LDYWDYGEYENYTKIMVLNLAPWTRYRERRTRSLSQDEWISLYNGRYNRQHKPFASSPDFYKTAKNTNPVPLKELQDEFVEERVWTSDRVIYHDNSLDGRIIYNFNSNIVNPNPSKKIIIPYFEYETLPNVLSNEYGLKLIKTIFSTRDKEEEIMENLEKLSGEKKKDILILTPSEEERSQFYERAILFENDKGSFVINVLSRPNYNAKSMRLLPC